MILNDQGGPGSLDSFDITFIPFAFGTFKGSIFHKQQSGRALFGSTVFLYWAEGCIIEIEEMFHAKSGYSCTIVDPLGPL